MTVEELKRHFPNATPDVIRRTATDAGQVAVLDNNPRKAPKPKRAVRDGTVGEVPVEGKHPKRFLVRVTSVRKNFLDEDNLCAKYHVDCCRYAGVIPGDAPKTTRIEVCQQKVESGAAEEVRIEIFQL